MQVPLFSQISGIEQGSPSSGIEASVNQKLSDPRDFYSNRPSHLLPYVASTSMYPSGQSHLYESSNTLHSPTFPQIPATSQGC